MTPGARAGGRRFRAHAEADPADPCRRDSSIEVVGTAMDGNFGLKKIEELKPQVVTLDLEMPGMDGIDMLQRDHAPPPLPVIVVSSHSTQGASSR